MVELEELEQIAIQFVGKKTGAKEVNVTQIEPYSPQLWRVRGVYKKDTNQMTFKVMISREKKVTEYKLGE